jgi:hypothetical protein
MEFSRSVLMPSGARVHAAIRRFARSSGITTLPLITTTMPAVPAVPAVATVAAAATVAAVTAVAEHVHRDEGDEDQHPEPICREPCHDVLLLGCASRRSLGYRDHSMSGPGAHSSETSRTVVGGNCAAIPKRILALNRTSTPARRFTTLG